MIAGLFLELVFVTLGIVLDLLFLLFTMSIARSKGYSPLGWGIAAIFFPLLTVLILLVLPSRRPAA